MLAGLLCVPGTPSHPHPAPLNCTCASARGLRRPGTLRSLPARREGRVGAHPASLEAKSHGVLAQSRPAGSAHMQHAGAHAGRLCHGPVTTHDNETCDKSHLSVIKHHVTSAELYAVLGINQETAHKILKDDLEAPLPIRLLEAAVSRAHLRAATLHPNHLRAQPSPTSSTVPQGHG